MMKWFDKNRRRSNTKLEISGPTDFIHKFHIDENDLPRHEVRFGRSQSEVAASAFCTMPRPRLDDRVASNSLLDHVVPHTTKSDLANSAGRYRNNSRPSLPPNWGPPRTPTSPVRIHNEYNECTTFENPAYFIPRGTPTSSGYGTTTNTFSSFGSKAFVNQVYVTGEMREHYRERSRERQVNGILKGGVYSKKDGAEGSLPRRLRANTPQNSPKPAPRRQLSNDPPPVPRPTQLSLSTPTSPHCDASMLDLTATSSISVSFSDERPMSTKVRELYDRPPSPGSSSDDELIITHF